MTTGQQYRRPPATAGHRRRCPSCGWCPDVWIQQRELRDDLETVWWSIDPRDPAQVVEGRHCVQCQPHRVYPVACRACGDGPILADELAEQASTTGVGGLPPAVTDLLVLNGWRPALDGSGWVCCR